jgi:hypothetical protein
MANQWLTPRAVDSHALAMDRESRLLLKAMLDESRGGLLPVDPHPYAGRCAFNVMAMIAFGTPLDDRLVVRGLELSREFMCVSRLHRTMGLFLVMLTLIPDMEQELHGSHVESRRLCSHTPIDALADAQTREETP